MLSKLVLFKLFLTLAILAPASAAPANDNKPCPPANAKSNAQGAPWCRTTSTITTPTSTSLASSVPEPTTSQTPAPVIPTPSGERKRCAVQALGGDADDAPAINRAFEECSQGGVVAFEYGVRYNAYTPVSALKLNGTKVEFYGNVHLPEDIPTVQAIVANPKVYDGYWFRFKGEGLEWVGTKDINAGWIDSHGQAWWDANPAGQGGLPNRPHLLRFDIKKSSIMHLKSEKPIGWNTRIVADDLYIEGTVVNAHSESGSFPFNTDGLGLSGTNILAVDSKIDNGDDCFAITTPSRNITMRKATCGGPGTHGLSIGSLGKNQAQVNTVRDITFEDITMIDALYGARFKSWVGGQGITENIKYHDIRLYNVTYPIAVTQTYVDQNNPGGDRVNNGSVILKNFSFKDWVGDINSFQPGDKSCISDPCWYEQDLPEFTGSQGIFFSCANEGSCQGFETENLRIYGQNGVPAEFLCKNVDAASNPNLGFTCADNL